MKSICYKLLILSVLLFISWKGNAQDFLFSLGNTVNINSSSDTAGYIYDDGGDTSNYSNGFSGTVIISANEGDTIELSGSFSLESGYDNLYVYTSNGQDSSCLINVFTGDNTLNLVSYTGYMTLYFQTDGSVNSSGLSLHYSIRPSSCSNFIRYFTATEVTPHLVRLNWSAIDNSGPFRLQYGNVDTIVNQNYANITGLIPDNTYTFTLYSQADSDDTPCSSSFDTVIPCFKAVVSGLRSLCGIDTVTLTADSADSYLWSTGETTRSIEISQVGDYVLTVFTDGGCSDSIQFTVSPIEFEMEITIPEHLCPGDVSHVQVGFDLEASVRVIRHESTLSEVSRIFLPDGIYCEPNGCSYRSELLFSGFASNARITDVNDIRYVMLNIEHSYAGDIYINITCPNSQSADIFRYSGSGSSECNSSIGPGSRSWQSGSNAPLYTHFGVANDIENNTYPCDSMALGNEPGTGWRYCWSNCTDAGYTYASGDGLIYRNNNVVSSSSGYTFDSSDVDAGTHFYHPDQSLASLIGCPMNGVWYIEVIDGWGVDNGYIFGWELALNPNRLVRNNYRPTVAYADLIGPWTTRLTDTTFNITAPSDLVNDTTVQYQLFITDSGGCVFDTTFTITFHGVYTRTVYDTVRESDLPRIYHDYSFNSDVVHQQLTVPAPNGCDSIIDYSLHVLPNSSQVFDTTLCINQLPIQWFHRLFTSEGTQYDTIQNHLGADSLLILTLHTLPIVFDTVNATICSNQSYAFEGNSYNAPGLYTHSFTSVAGCDSLRTLHLIVNNISQRDTFADACNSFYWNGTLYTSSDTVTSSYLVPNVFGCDSIVTLYLNLRYSTSSIVYDTVLENDLPHNYHGTSFLSDTTDVLFTLTGSNGCDSLVHYNLFVIHNSSAIFDTTICADQLPIQWYHRIFYQAGTQYDTIENYLGADSLLTLTIHTSPVYHDTLPVTICSNQSYSFNDHTYNTSGFYLNSFQTVNGCDSLITIHLVVNNTSQGDTFAVACDSFTWMGQYYTQSDTVTIPQFSLNALGCDSSVTLYLTVNHSSSNTVFDTVLENNLPRNYHGINLLSDTSNLIITIPNTSGCDSSINYNLYVLRNSYANLDTTLCANQLPLQWFHRTFTVAGTQYDTIPNHLGADSLLTLTLHVAPVYNDTVSQTICSNQSTLFEGTSYNLSGNYTHTFSTSLGCDSLRTLHLVVNQTSEGDTFAVVCDTFDWHNHHFNSNSVIVVPAYTVNALGCDSSVTLHLTVNHSTNCQVFETIFESELPYNYHGIILYNDTSDLPVVIPNSVGCDSNILYNLIVNWNSFHSYDTTICSNMLPFSWHGHLFNAPGHLVDTLISSHGADSVISLTLYVNPAYDNTFADTTCQGTPYQFGPAQLMQSGTYHDTLYTMMGCDSLLTLILSVIDPVDLSIADEFYCNSPEHYALSASYHDGWRYHWTSLPPDASMGSQANYGSIVVNPRQTTTYYVQASYGASGWCPQLDSISLNPIVPLHVVWDVKPDYLTEDNLLVTASNLSSGYTSQSWFVDGNRMDEPGSQFTYECGRETDSIILMLVINNEMCTDTATKTIRMQTASIYFPNVFTPGMDDNNRFAPIYTGIVDYEIWIYDRQGMLVYYSTEPQPGWDGTHNGSPCRQATYVYHCRYRNQLMPKGYLTATGTVTLLR